MLWGMKTVGSSTGTLYAYLLGITGIYLYELLIGMMVQSILYGTA